MKLGEWQKSLSSKPNPSSIKVSQMGNFTRGLLDRSGYAPSNNEYRHDTQDAVITKTIVKNTKLSLARQDAMFWQVLGGHFAPTSIPSLRICVKSYQMLSKFVALLTVERLPTGQENVWISSFWLKEQWESHQPLHLIHPLLRDITNEEDLCGRFILLLDQVRKGELSMTIYNPIHLEYQVVGVHRFFTKEHEWVQKMEGTRVRFGITDYAQKSLGDLVYVELPKIGDKINKTKVVGVVESVKGASDVFAPVSGTIVSVNEAVKTKPSLINKYAESEGWLCEVEMTDEIDLAGLFSSDQYQQHLKGQSSH